MRLANAFESKSHGGRFDSCGGNTTTRKLRVQRRKITLVYCTTEAKLTRTSVLQVVGVAASLPKRSLSLLRMQQRKDRRHCYHALKIPWQGLQK